jgi:hypothetical protein
VHRLSVLLIFFALFIEIYFNVRTYKILSYIEKGFYYIMEREREREREREHRIIYPFSLLNILTLKYLFLHILVT